MDRPIGVFDSGVGGISVLRELYALMGNENFIYFGDSANAPYGEKTKEEVRALSFEVAKKLMDMGVKALVIACNTATSAAAKELREKYGDKLSIIGLEPALKPAVMENKGKTIAVMATPLTLREEKFLGLLASYEKDAKIIPLEAPGLAEMIEKGILEGEKIENYLKELFADLPKVDALVLGCTHYPLIKDTIKKVRVVKVPTGNVSVNEAASLYEIIE